MKKFSLLTLVGPAIALLFSGCASSLIVTPVPAGHPECAKGITYYLPKPFLVASPQPDGTVNFDVVFLPDKSHEYAIQPSSSLSAYTFQISRDEKGLLNSIEYKADTSLVGQQLAGSAGAAATQWYNMDAAQLGAVQTQVNTAQAALDSANSTIQAATAALAADQANQPTNFAVIAADQNALAQAQAKLPTAELAFQRAKSSSQAVAVTASASTPGTQAGPTISTYFTQPTGNQQYTTSLPQRFGPVLYSINDSVESGVESVSLKAVTSKIKGTTTQNAPTDITTNDYEYRTVPDAQPIFETYQAAKPVLTPSVQTIDANSQSVMFQFSSPVAKVSQDLGIAKDDFAQTVVTNFGIQLSRDHTYLTINFSSKFAPGNYVMTVPFGYQAFQGSPDPQLGFYVGANTKVKFTVQKDSVPVLSPSNQTVSTNANSVSFSFNKSILKIVDIKISPDSGSSKPQIVSASLAGDKTILNVAVQNVAAVSYSVDVTFTYSSDTEGSPVQAKQTIKFTAK